MNAHDVPIVATPEAADSAATETVRKLTARRLLTKNVGWNLLGQGLPLLVAILTIPALVASLGTDRFGLLTLVWLLVGYFSLFDLGLARALTKFTADKIAAGEEADVGRLVRTTLGLMVAVGVATAGALVLIAPWLANSVLKIPLGMQGETERALYLLAVAVPLVTTTSALTGVLAAYQRFDIINAIGAPVSILAYIGPWVVAMTTPTLPAVALAVVVTRVLAFAAIALACGRTTPAFRNMTGGCRTKLGPLLRFGGWTMVSAIVGPFLVYLDRFLIGVWLSTAAVAYYAAPYSVVTRLLLIPSIVAQVLFPAFAATFVNMRPRAEALYERGLRDVLLVMFPISIVAVLAAQGAMVLWLGPEFASHSTTVLQLLAIGVFLNSVAWIPLMLLQGAGRPDVSAKLYLLELPVYLLLLWAMMSRFGVDGAAAAWSIRVAADAVLLLLLASLTMPESRPYARKLVLWLFLTGALLLVGVVLESPELKLAYGVCVLAAFAAIVWLRVLGTAERSRVGGWLRALPAGARLRVRQRDDV